MKQTPFYLVAACSVALAGGCGGPPAALPSHGFAGRSAVPRRAQSLEEPLGDHAIKHVVVIVQENRTVDNVFNGFPGADTVRSGRNTYGQMVELVATSLSAPYDLSHKHSAWSQDYHGGDMDGFNTETENCYASPSQCPPADIAAYGFVPEAQVQPYWDMAQQYTFADRMFQTNQGPSFPAHQYLVSGTSSISDNSALRASENATNPLNVPHQGGCDSLPDSTVETIDPKGVEGNPTFPCFDRKSIFGVMNDQGVTWRYYQEFGDSGAWHAVDALKPIWSGPTYVNVIWPSKGILQDIQAGHLADVTFVTPSKNASDHAGKNDGSGPSWVASIVNSIGQSSYWKDTAIFVTWDDWGGWFDHVKPTIYTSYEDGFRVPLIVISPYAKKGHISHTAYEFGSILKFIEQAFDLPSLGTSDVRAHDLNGCFDFRRQARAFTLIHAPFPGSYFKSLPIDYESPDDDH